jgi:hypothetical protein
MEYAGTPFLIRCYAQRTEACTDMSLWPFRCWFGRPADSDRCAGSLFNILTLNPVGITTWTVSTKLECQRLKSTKPWGASGSSPPAWRIPGWNRPPARKTNNQASFGGSILKNNMEVEAAMELRRQRHLDETGVQQVHTIYAWGFFGFAPCSTLVFWVCTMFDSGKSLF